MNYMVERFNYKTYKAKRRISLILRYALFELFILEVAILTYLLFFI